MECTAPETNVKLVAIGYKYNAKKVLCFVMTKNAGSTLPGNNPYRAKYPDLFGNVKERLVERPDVLGGTYFAHSNLIDILNHLRRGILALERHWRTKNPWFRLDVTCLGVTAIDCYGAAQCHVPALRGLSVSEFADCLAWDCTHNPFSKVAGKVSICNPKVGPRDGYHAACLVAH